MTHGNLIGGRWVDGAGNIEDRNPADREEVVGVFARGTPEDMTAAVRAAGEAFPAWASLAAPARGAVLFRAAELLDGRFEQLSSEMTREEGKTLPERGAPEPGSLRPGGRAGPRTGPHPPLRLPGEPPAVLRGGAALLPSRRLVDLFQDPAGAWEHCCDDAAVSLCGSPVKYARALALLESELEAVTRALSPFLHD